MWHERAWPIWRGRCETKVSMGRSQELGLRGDQVPMGRVSESIQLVCRQGMGPHGNKGWKYRSGLDHGDHECWLKSLNFIPLEMGPSMEGFSWDRLRVYFVYLDLLPPTPPTKFSTAGVHSIHSELGPFLLPLPFSLSCLLYIPLPTLLLVCLPPGVKAPTDTKSFDRYKSSITTFWEWKNHPRGGNVELFKGRGV